MLELYESCDSDSVTKRYFEEKNKLEDLLIHEEAYWKQRAKSFWLPDGDSKSKFFHAFTTIRKKKSSISQLKDENEEYVQEHEGMCRVVKSYFLNFFGQVDELQERSLPTVDPVISEEQNRKLEEDFTLEEFFEAVQQMHPAKSAGPDGLNPAFYQNFWPLLGRDVFQCCASWLKNVVFPSNLNDTLLV